MIPVQPFLPLYFGDEDKDLWAFLAEIPAERRSSFVKEALREHLAGPRPASRWPHRWGLESAPANPADLAYAGFPQSPDLGKRTARASKEPPAAASETQQSEAQANVSPAGRLAVVETETALAAAGEFSLADLFVGDAPQVAAEGRGSAVYDSCRTAALERAAVPKPDALSFLLDQVIGVEEDPEVVAAVLHHAQTVPGGTGHPGESGAGQGAGAPLNETQVPNHAELSADSCVCPGLNHLLNVIGEEDDEEVVAFIRQRLDR